MTTHPSIIKVAPAEDGMSVQTVEHEYQRTTDHNDYDFSITNQDELDHVDEMEQVTGRYI